MILAFFCTTGISFLCIDYIGHLFHDACVIFCCLLVLCLLAHSLPLCHSCHPKIDRYTLQVLDSMELYFLEFIVFLFHLQPLAFRTFDSP